jgi:uncharacterized protein YoxC
MSPEDSRLLAIFTGIVAISFLVQCIAFLFLARTVSRLAIRVEELSKGLSRTAESISEKVEGLLSSVKTSAENLKTLQENLTATSEVIHKRAVSVDRFLSDATDSARLQIIRIQDTVDMACRRTEYAVDLLYRGVIRPVSEAGAIMNGLRAGLAVFLRRTNPPAVRARREDEEMFI